MSLLIQKKQEIINKYNLDQDKFNELLEEFIDYWTESSINGKKQRWQKEKTFDPVRRFGRWIRNNQKWNKPSFESEEQERQRKLAHIEEQKKALYTKFKNNEKN